MNRSCFLLLSGSLNVNLTGHRAWLIFIFSRGRRHLRQIPYFKHAGIITNSLNINGTLTWNLSIFACLTADATATTSANTARSPCEIYFRRDLLHFWASTDSSGRARWCLNCHSDQPAARCSAYGYASEYSVRLDYWLCRLGACDLNY